MKKRQRPSDKSLLYLLKDLDRRRSQSGSKPQRCLHLQNIGLVSAEIAVSRPPFHIIGVRQHRRRPTKSGIVSWFSGLLYCADCGEKLYYSVTNNYKREQAYFFCSSFRKNSDERYATLSMSYEEEQRELKTALPDMENYLETETDKTENLQRFIDKVKRITEIKELTAELVHEFIDKIVVHAPRHLDGKRVQLIDIYYNGVGILRELTPEEMEEAFQNHMAERKAKTA